MKHADPDKLATLVTDVVMSSSHAKRFKGVDIEDATYDEDDEIGFIRILIHLKNLEKIPDDDIGKIISSVEGAVAQQDDRFPNIRFSEP